MSLSDKQQKQILIIIIFILIFMLTLLSIKSIFVEFSDDTKKTEQDSSSQDISNIKNVTKTPTKQPTETPMISITPSPTPSPEVIEVQIPYEVIKTVYKYIIVTPIQSSPTPTPTFTPTPTATPIPLQDVGWTYEFDYPDEIICRFPGAGQAALNYIAADRPYMGTANIIDLQATYIGDITLDSEFWDTYYEAPNNFVEQGSCYLMDDGFYGNDIYTYSFETFSNLGEEFFVPITYNSWNELDNRPDDGDFNGISVPSGNWTNWIEINQPQ